jgi:hypothetical protein
MSFDKAGRYRGGEMDGDGGGIWNPSPWHDVVISVSPLPLRLSVCGTWGSIYIEAP